MRARTNPDHIENRMDKLEQMVKNAFYNKENNDMHHDNHDMRMPGMFNRRYTRQARNSLDLGDLTCILQEVNVLDSQNEISLAAMKKDMEQYNLPSAWFKNHYEQTLDTCYEMATTLPAEINQDYEVVGDFGKINMAQIKMFMGCCHKAKA